MKHFLCILIALISIQLSGCRKKTTQTQSAQETMVLGQQKVLDPVKNDRLVLWLQANPEILNPILATDGYSREVSGHIFESLIRYNTMTGDPVGLIAESWTVSPDGLSYVFQLRKNIHFHDGKPLTADDVKFTFDTIKNPKVDAAHLQNYYGPLDSVLIRNPYEVEFKFKSKYFRNLIMIGLADILPKHIYGQGDFNKSPANRNPVGSGPYQLVKWDTGSSISLKRFKDYWGKNDEHYKKFYNFNEILFRVITDDRVAVMATKKHEIDTIEPTPYMYMKDFVGPEIERQFYKLRFNTDDGNGYRFIGWNLDSFLFKTKSVRQALAMAMPREAINKKIFDGIFTLSVGPFPQGSASTDPNIQPYPYDLASAKSLLQQDAWKDSNNDGLLDKDGKPFSFELLFVAGNPEVERIALLYQQSLKEIGIEMKLRTLEWTVFIKQIEERKFDSIMMAWGSSLDSDPYQIWHSSQAKKGGSNRINYKNPEVDRLLERARETLDRPARNKIYQEFSKIIHDEAPYLFIFERPALLLADKRIQNVLPLGKLGSESAGWFVPFGQERYATITE